MKRSLWMLQLGFLLAGCGDADPEYISRAREKGRFELQDVALDFKALSSECSAGVDENLIELEAACIEAARNHLDVEGESLCRQERLRILKAVAAFFENSWFAFQDERDMCLIESLRILDEDLAYDFCDQRFKEKVDRLSTSQCQYERLQAEAMIFQWSVQP